MKKVFIIFSALGFAFAVTSEVTLISAVLVSYATGAIEFLVWIILIPVIAHKAKKLRAKDGSHGSESLRTVGWLLYWLSIANGIMLFQWGLFNGTGNNVTPATLIILNAFMFLISAIFMYIDYSKSTSN